MTDMMSEVRPPLVQAPIAWVARRLLASDASVKAVMVVGDDGKVLAHERAAAVDEFNRNDEEESPLLYYASKSHLLFYLRLNGQQVGRGLSDRIMATISSPSPAMTP